MSEENPVFPGLYRGLVVDTADPRRMNRLLCQCPAVNGKDTLDWAMPCFPLLTREPQLIGTAGEDALNGKTEPITVRLPAAGTPVWLMFEHGDARKPVWLGSWMGV